MSHYVSIQFCSPVGASPVGLDASGGLVVTGGDAGESEPTVVTFVGDLVGEGAGRIVGSLRGCRGAGVIRAGLERSPNVADALRPVVKGSGAVLRGGMMEAREVRPGRGERTPIGGIALGMPPI